MQYLDEVDDGLHNGSLGSIPVVGSVEKGAEGVVENVVHCSVCKAVDTRVGESGGYTSNGVQ